MSPPSARRGPRAGLGLCLAALSLCLASVASATPRVAVLELHAPDRFDAAPLRFLSDVVRGAAAETLGADFFVLTRENLEAVLPPDADLADCAGDCEITLGRKIGADQVVSGELLRIDGVLAISLQLHSTQDGRLVGRETARADALSSLEAPLAAAAGRLVARLAPRPAGQGTLVVRGTSGLEVFIDGVQAGTTPLSRTVDAGDHRLRVASRCHSPIEIPAEVRAGERRLVDLSPPPRTVPVQVDALDATGAPVAATVRVDGRPIGDAPGPFDVPVCSRQIEVIGPQDRWRSPLTLSPDEPTRLTATLASAQRAAVPQQAREANGGISTAGWLFIGGATSLLAGVAYAGKNAADGEALQLDPNNQALRDAADNSYEASMGLYGLGAGLVGLSVVWWALSDDEDDDSALLWGAGPGGAMVRGRF